MTMMSYNDLLGYDDIKYDPGTPMVLDVLALQYLYGTNYSTNSGNSTHRLLHTGVYKTIWDASGTDTVTSEKSIYGWEIQLPYIELSNLVTHKAGYAISDTNEETLVWLLGDIENATGSNSDDTIYGNAGNNILLGLDGADDIYCGGGSDTLTGGNGADYFYFYTGDGSNIITDFDQSNDKCIFLDSDGNSTSYFSV